MATWEDVQKRLAAGKQQGGLPSSITARLANRPTSAGAHGSAHQASSRNDPTTPAGVSLAKGALQGATLGFSDEASGAISAALQKAATDDPEGFAELYRRYRDEERSSNAVAEKDNPGSYMGGQIAGGAATAIAGSPVTLGRAVAAGAGLGAAAGLGGSQADLTKGDIKGAAKDMAIGAAIGGATAGIGHGIGKGLQSGANALRDLGRARLFKAAVGQNKRAFTQINGKGLWDKSTEYLDAMGIGAGDSTESIGAKLAQRKEKLGEALGDIVSTLDASDAPKISPLDVAMRIENEVAEPLKKLAATQNEYRQVLKEMDNILAIGDDVNFSQAAAQRRGYQQQVNYDKRQGLDVSADAKRKIAAIWNDVIDEKAAPALEMLGKGSKEYRELRHESALVDEILGHVNDRIAGNAANRVVSPTDYGAGGIASLMTGNPYAGIAAATANHLGRVYGNAAAGRAAINVAKMAAGSAAGARALVPAAGRAYIIEPGIGDDEEAAPLQIRGTPR